MEYVGAIVINSQLNLVNPNMEVGGVAYDNSQGFNQIIVDIDFRDAVIILGTVQFDFVVPTLDILTINELFTILQTNPILNQFTGWVE